MNWEVPTMTSRISCFDRAIFLRELRRAAPLWALYLLALLVPPLELVASFDPAGVNDFSETLGSYANAFSCVVPFVYGAALAWVLHASLFRTVPTNFYAALPLRRETLFLTRWLTGLLTALVPNLLSALLTLAVTTALGTPLPADCLRFFAAATLGFLFFYGLGTLCCMVSGHAAMMPVLYLILNFTVIVVEMVVQVLLESFVYGMPPLGTSPLAAFSPLYYMLFGGHYDLSTSYLGIPDPGSWRYLALLSVVGIAFSLLALFFFRRRDMERSGDIITVRWLRPVFQYAFTLGCALIFCQVVKSLIRIPSFSSSFCAVMALLLLGAFLGHIAARMMLMKSVRVFRGGWLSLLVCCAVLAVGFGSMRLDLFGYSRRIPDTEEIQSVCLQPYDSMEYMLETPDAIQAVRTLHERFIREREELSATKDTSLVYLIYELKNGKTLRRRFPLPTGETQPGTLEYEFDQVYNSTSFVLARTVPAGLSEANMVSCTIVYTPFHNDSDGAPATASYDQSSSLTLGSQEAWTFYTTAILPDFEDSSLGRSSFPLYSYDAETDGYRVEFYFGYYDDPNAAAEDRITRAFQLSLTSDAARTIAYLQKLGYRVS